MNIWLYDVDSSNFPNLALMKISAWHKQQGDTVEMLFKSRAFYDKIYVSKIFSDEYSKMTISPSMLELCAKEVVYGGTGFAMAVKEGKETYDKTKDFDLPDEIEHIYPDYDLYPELTKNKAFGFLTRGCPNNCSFCVVSKKEGRCSVKVADLSEWWNGQKEIVLLDPNLLACKERVLLLEQLAKSGAKVEFSQGLDARFLTEEVCEILKRIKKSVVHFAFDFIENEKAIMRGLENYMRIVKPAERDVSVYILTNYNTTFEQDLYRVKLVQSLGLCPDIRIYRKHTAPQITRWLQRWSNNRFIYQSQKDFLEYIPNANGKKVKDYLKESI
jgi:hypothetical protein